MDVGRAATGEGETIQPDAFEVTAEDVAAAMTAVDSYVRNRF